MPTVLITGANRGLGLEFAKQYAERGWRVLATCRDVERADVLASIKGQVDIYELDIKDPPIIVINKKYKLKLLSVFINESPELAKLLNTLIIISKPS